MIYASGIFSLVVQFVVGIIDYAAINIEVTPKDEILKDLLKVELVVQIIEFIFYIFLIYYFSQVSKNINWSLAILAIQDFRIVLRRVTFNCYFFWYLGERN